MEQPGVLREMADSGARTGKLREILEHFIPSKSKKILREKVGDIL